MTEGILLAREGNKAYCNVPPLVKHHSPAGFNWGYAGSGPADLALNICEHICSSLDYGSMGDRVKTWDGNTVCRLAWNMHQDFKFRFLVDVPNSGLHKIPYATAETWVHEWVLEYLDKVDDLVALEEEKLHAFTGKQLRRLLLETVEYYHTLLDVQGIFLGVPEYEMDTAKQETVQDIMLGLQEGLLEVDEA
jgi:hypothetical protein